MRGGLIVAHDSGAVPSVRRARALLSAASSRPIEVLLPDEDPTVVPARVEDGVYGLSGQDVYGVVHVITDPEWRAVNERDEIDLGDVAEQIREAYPALNVVQYVILAAGRRLDAAEERLAQSAVARNDCRAVLVTASSTEASPAHTEAEQSGFTADLVALGMLGGLDSPALQGRLWVAGLTSVVYRQKDIAQAMTAHQAVGLLRDGLLAPVGANDVNRDLGSAEVDGLDLGGDTEVEHLLRDPLGGSVEQRVDVPDVDLDDVPIRYWVDRLTSLHDELVATEVRVAMHQIERRTDDRLEELWELLRAAALGKLRERRNIAQTRAFVDGMDDALARIERQLQHERARQQNRGYDAMSQARENLSRAIARLPFGSAAAARGTLLAVFVLTIGAALTAEADLSAPAGWLAALVGAAAALVLWAKYHQFRRAVLTARDAYVHAIERRLKQLVRGHAWDELLRLVRRLRRRLSNGENSADSDLMRLETEAQRAATELEDFARTRVPEELLSTRYAISLPHWEDLSTEVLLQRFPPDREPAELERALVLTLFEHTWSVSSSEIQDGVWETLGDLSYQGLWSDLWALLADSEVTRNRAVTTLGRGTLPLLVDADRRTALPSVTRAFHVADSPHDHLSEMIERPATDAVPGLTTDLQHDFNIDPRVVHLDGANVAFVLNIVPLDNVLVPEDGEAP